ncbi:glycosyltransferase [Vibrio cholerae]|uniref:glycosyltransferase n=1 Tax=Vibrio cholerae TaxID=666 RepID=UPI001156F853|nr:glycosyltransferase [Vibrio cholerae]TQP75348.1 glycosyltransferase [Vibrio cholerae]
MNISLVHYIEQIRPGGGPRGYLNNLNEQVKINGSLIVSIMSRNATNNRQKNTVSAVRKIGLIGSIQRLIYYFIFGFRDTYKFTSDEIIELRKASIIIFHRRGHLDSYFRQVKNRGEQMVFAMPHNPISPIEESISLMPISHGVMVSKIWRLITKLLCKMEVESFSKADGLLLASENSTESYYASFPELKNKFDSIKKYVINSGVNELVVNKNFESDNILPEQVMDKIKVCFFGRYESVKGYDIFIDLAKSKKFLDSYCFISAGSGSKSVDSFDNYFNLGWRNDIAELIYSADVIVVPNRVSYFDLIILESLSLGKPVVTSNVGGGRDIYGTGVYKYNNTQELEEILLSKKYLSNCPLDIKANFLKKYSSNAMLSRYENLAKSICKGL